jgi:hypothetical protein
VIVPIDDRLAEIRRKPSYRVAVWLLRLTCVGAFAWACIVAIADPLGGVGFLVWASEMLVLASTLALVRLSGIHFDVFTRRRGTWPLERERGRQFYRDVV